MALLVAGAQAWARPPEWLRELAEAPLPAQPAEVEAVQLLHEVELTVTADGRMLKQVRGAVRILRREATERAVVSAPQDTWRKVRDMRGWMIPASGKDIEVRMADAVDVSAAGGGGNNLVTDLRVKVLRIPGATLGATIGYEYELALNPLELADTFDFQDSIPVREARYSLRLPGGWNVLPTWLNHEVVAPLAPAPQQWQWTLKDIPSVAVEQFMPARRSVSGHLYLAISPPGKPAPLGTWAGIGSWYLDLSRDRRLPSDDIRQEVARLTAGLATPVEKARALAGFVQREVRYVSIQLGIGGFQPHAAADVFRYRYGDCKDKATLLQVMLAEAGIESAPVIVNTERSRIRADMPASLQFNHVILAIRLPAEVQPPALLATMEQGGAHWLFFDATDELTPFGRIRGELQGSVGLLAMMQESRLVTLPALQPLQSGTHRSARLALNELGVLTGAVSERSTGQAALAQRGALRAMTREADASKIIEARLAQSLAAFQLAGAAPRNRDAIELPLEWEYSITAPAYARRSGELLIVRPRVLGVESLDLPGEGRPRIHDLMLIEPLVNVDEIVIELPAGYGVDSLPQPVELDAGFASYRSRTEVNGSELKYTRTLEVRALQVPAARIEEFRQLQREIARDERAVVMLKKTGS